MRKLEGRPLGQRCLCSQRFVGLNYKDFSVAFIGLLVSHRVNAEEKCARGREVAARDLPD